MPFDLASLVPGQPVKGRHITDLYAGLTGQMTDQPVTLGNNLTVRGVTGLREIATPASPSTGVLAVYPKADHKLYTLDSSGLETQLGAAAANGLPTGGTTGQVLTKTSATDFASNWQTPFSQALADARYPLKTDTDPYPQYLTQAEGDARYQPTGSYLTQASADTRYLQLSGGTLTGLLTLSGNPSTALQAATKQYVDSHDMPAGGSANQVLAKSSATDYATSWVTPFSQATADARYLQLTGGTLTGLLTLSADPSTNLQAATKQYADTKLTQAQADARYQTPAQAAALYVPLAGGTMTGPLVLSADPSAALGAVTKQYADSHDMPTGGTVNQVLAKSSSANYATQWVNQTGGAGGSAAVLVYEAQAVTGSTVTLPQTPMSNGVVGVYVNGQALMQTRDWTLSGAVITFTPALTADDVHVEYMASGFNASTTPAHYETQLSVGQTTLTLPIAPVGTPLLSRGGVVQYQTAGHYSVSGTTITLADPIVSSEDGRISVDYEAGAGAIASGSPAGGVLTGTYPNPGLADASVTNAKLASDTARLNLLTNGGFEIWQRGNGPFTATLCSDAWRIGTVGTDTLSVSRNTANVDAASVACAACTFTLGTGAGATQIFQQMNLLGDGPDVAGKTITLSMRVRCSTANAVRIGINNLYASASHWTYSGFHTGDGTYQTLSVTAAIDPTATFVQAGPFFAVSCTAYVDNAMLVVGSQAADYAPLHPADDLARCLRYYQAYQFGASVLVCLTQCGTTTGAYGGMPLQARVAVAPTVTFSPPGTFALWNAGTTPLAVTSGPSLISGMTATSTAIALNANVASGLVAGNASGLIAGGSGASILVEANP